MLDTTVSHGHKGTENGLLLYGDSLTFWFVSMPSSMVIGNVVGVPSCY
jgi:hypothetical protein